MRINWEIVKPSLWTGAGGVVVGMVLLSYGFGYMSSTAAERLATTSSERAVTAVLAPICADKFRAQPDVAARTAALIADKDNSYKMREAFPEAMDAQLTNSAAVMESALANKVTSCPSRTSSSVR